MTKKLFILFLIFCILPVIPSAASSDVSVLIAETDFNSLREGVTISGAYSFSHIRENDGTTSIHMHSDAETAGNSYFDITGENLGISVEYVIDMRFKINMLSDGSVLQFFDTKNQAGSWRYGYTISSEGVLYSRESKTSLGRIAIGEWTRISVSYNLNSATAEVYINGEYIATHSVKANYSPVMFRVDVASPIGQVHDSQIDWLRIYTGSELHDGSYFHDEIIIGSEITDDEVKKLPTVMDNEEKQLKALDGKTVFMLTNETMYINGQKESYAQKTAKPYIIDGILMIPHSILMSMTDLKIVCNDENTLLIGDVVLKIGKSEYTLSGTKYILDYAPFRWYGEFYIPVKNVAEQILGKYVLYDNREMIIVSDTPVAEVSDYHYLDRYFQFYDTDLIYRYMQYDNPSGEEMISEVEKRFPQNQHPRILYTKEDISYILAKVQTEPEWKESYDAAIAEAQKVADREYKNRYAGVADSGKQNTAANCTTIITKLATAYLLTGNEIYAQKGIDVLKELAAWENLAISTSQLITGDWALSMAIGFDSFYNYMMQSQEGKEDIEYLKDRIKRLTYFDHITSYAGVGTLTYFTMQDNFLGYVSGAVLPLTLALCDEEDLRVQSAYIMENVMKSLEIYLGLFFPNGGYYEAISYSAYGFSHFLYGLNALFNCCGTDYGFGYAKGFKDAGDFFTYAQSVNYNFAFHDAGSLTYQSNAVRELMAYRYGEYDQAAIADKWYRLTGNNKNLYTLFLYSKAMDNGGNTDISDMPLDYYFYGADVGTFTNSRTISNPVFAGFHGGWTGIPHSMLDLGEFIFESDGVRWATDLGADSYSLPSYFSDQGYRIYRKRPEGENCIVLNPSDTNNYYGQKIGALARLIDYESKSRGAKAAYDLTEAYERDAESYIRGYYFGDERHSFTVQDELKLSNATELYWFMHTPAEITIVDNTKAILTSPESKRALIVDVYCNIPGYTLEVMDAKPLPDSPTVEGQNANEGITKLAIHAPEAVDDVTIAVKLSPDYGEKFYTPLEVKPISKWMIPDGELISSPEFTGIYLDGKLIDGFTEGKHSYDIELSEGAIPTVTATANEGLIDIKQPSGAGDYALITVYKDGVRPVECVINFTAAKTLSIVSKGYSASGAFYSENEWRNNLVSFNADSVSAVLSNPVKTVEDTDITLYKLINDEYTKVDAEISVDNTKITVMPIDGFEQLTEYTLIMNRIFATGAVAQRTYEISFQTDGYFKGYTHSKNSFSAEFIFDDGLLLDQIYVIIAAYNENKMTAGSIFEINIEEGDKKDITLTLPDTKGGTDICVYIWNGLAPLSKKLQFINLK